MKKYYEIIGVSENASYLEIKTEYLKKIKEYHPDLYEGDKLFAEQKTAELNEAFDMLKNLHENKSNKVALKKESKKVKEKTNKFAIFFKNIWIKIKAFFNKIFNFNKNKKDLINADRERKKLNLIIIIQTLVILILLIILLF